MYVYMLKAEGTDWLTCNGTRIVHSITAFVSEKLANSRIEKFRQMTIDQKKLLGDEEIIITIIPIEVIEDDYLTYVADNEEDSCDIEDFISGP